MRPYTPATLLRSCEAPQVSVLDDYSKPTLETTHRKEEGNGNACLDVEEADEGRQRAKPPLRAKSEFHHARRR